MAGARVAAAVRCLLAAFLMFAAGSVGARGWIRAETNHFLIYSNVSTKITREYVEQLEAFKQLAELLLGASSSSASASARFTIYLFDDQDLLNVVRPGMGKHYGGVYMHCVEGANAFAWRPVQYSDQDTGLQTLQHEYTHHLMFSRMQHFYPSWYVEGFADYMSTVTLSSGAYMIGGNHRERYYILSSEMPWLDFRLMLDQRQYVAQASKGKVDLSRFYAQSWLLAHYMLADTQRTQAFSSYFDRAGRGEDAIVSFEEATGIPVDKLSSMLHQYLQSLHGIRATIPGISNADVTVTELPKSEGEYLLQAAVLQTCPGADQAKELLTQFRSMRAEHANDDHFLTELARAELLFGDVDIARTMLESLSVKDDAGFDTFYLLGRSYYTAAQKATSESRENMNKASREFLTAYRLNKLDAPNLYFLSRSLDDDGGAPAKSVINAANAAAILAPSVQEYAMSAAFIDLRAGDTTTAIRVMQPFASNPHDPAGARRIAAFVEGLRQGKSVAELWAIFEERDAETSEPGK